MWPLLPGTMYMYRYTMASSGIRVDVMLLIKIAQSYDLRRLLRAPGHSHVFNALECCESMVSLSFLLSFSACFLWTGIAGKFQKVSWMKRSLCIKTWGFSRDRAIIDTELASSPGPPTFLRVTLKRWEGLGTRLILSYKFDYESIYRAVVWWLIVY